MALLDRVVEVAAETFGEAADKMDSSTGPDTLRKWDSIGHMNLMLAVEQAFNVHYELDEMMEAIDLGTIVAQLKVKGLADE